MKTSHFKVSTRFADVGVGAVTSVLKEPFALAVSTISFDYWTLFI
jgi:hypothetical protein